MAGLTVTLVCVAAAGQLVVQSDHLSGKPGNVREFD